MFIQLIIIITLFISNSANAIANERQRTNGILPENNLYIPEGQKSSGGITEEQFNRVLDKINYLFSNIVKASGAELVITRRWSDGTVNAYADQDVAGKDEIVMFGGFARHPAITEDGMALVSCHELGHHLGGAPRKTDDYGEIRWAAVEGQADYWSAMKCLRYYFQGDNNFEIVKNLNVPAYVVKQCGLVYSDNNERAICQRTAMAGWSLGNLFFATSNGITPIKFETPDNLVVSGATWEGHPRPQCRLDTYLQAALCNHGITESTSNDDTNQGVCSHKNGNNVGTRPLCWYKPGPEDTL